VPKSSLYLYYVSISSIWRYMYSRAPSAVKQVA